MAKQSKTIGKIASQIKANVEKINELMAEASERNLQVNVAFNDDGVLVIGELSHCVEQDFLVEPSDAEVGIESGE